MDLVWLRILIVFGFGCVRSKWSTCKRGENRSSAEHDIVFDGELQVSFSQSNSGASLILCNKQSHTTHRCFHCWFLPRSIPLCWVWFLHLFPGTFFSDSFLPFLFWILLNTTKITVMYNGLDWLSLLDTHHSINMNILEIIHHLLLY